MTRRFNRLLITVASGAALAVAGHAVANVPNDDYTVVAKKSAGTTALVDVSGNEYEVAIQAICDPFSSSEDDAEIGSAVLASTNHFDGAKLKFKE